MALRLWHFAFAAVAVAPSMALAQEKPIDISLGTLPAATESAAGARVSLGSVGPDNRTTGSYVPERGGDPYYFNIPSERPFKSVPGIMLHIPLGTDSNR
jgi:hypothetical protein